MASCKKASGTEQGHASVSGGDRVGVPAVGTFRGSQPGIKVPLRLGVCGSCRRDDPASTSQRGDGSGAQSCEETPPATKLLGSVSDGWDKGTSSGNLSKRTEQNFPENGKRKQACPWAHAHRHGMKGRQTRFYSGFSTNLDATPAKGLNFQAPVLGKPRVAADPKEQVPVKRGTLATGNGRLASAAGAPRPVRACGRMETPQTHRRHLVCGASATSRTPERKRTRPWSQQEPGAGSTPARP